MKKHASNPLCPVSKKFYAYLSVRVRESLVLIGREDAVAEAMACIDRYMADGSLPQADSCPAILLSFSILRPEIDKAVMRSSRARSRNAKKVSISAADNQNVMASADANSETTDAGEERGEPEHFVPRNRRERRLYEQEVRRATRRIVRRLVRV